MAVAAATITTNIWDAIRGYINHASVTNNAVLISAYAKTFTKDASGKDFVAIHKPNVSEEMLTVTKKKYPFSIDIEIVVSEEEQLKVISDAVRARIESNRATARTTDGLLMLRFTNDEITYEERDNVRMFHNILTIEGLHLGG